MYNAMMNVQTISVTEYFDYDQNTSLERLLMGHNILLGDNSRMGFVNKVMSKNEVICLASKLHENRNPEFTSLWISSDAIRVKEMRDYMGERIFPEVDGEISGWLVFYDTAIFMNWSHPCEYHLIVNEECMETCSHSMGPDGIIKMENI